MAARFRSVIFDEKKRSTVCAAVTILVAAPIIYLWLRHEGAPAEHARAVGAVIVWTPFAVVDAGATLLAYRGLTRAQLIAVLTADTGAATHVESPRAAQQQSESVSATLKITGQAHHMMPHPTVTRSPGIRGPPGCNRGQCPFPDHCVVRAQERQRGLQSSVGRRQRLPHPPHSNDVARSACSPVRDHTPQPQWATR